MQNDWRSWRTEGAWLTDGQKRALDDIGASLIALFLVGTYIWLNW